MLCCQKAFAILAVACSLQAALGPVNAAEGTVSGSVKVGGKPLVSGRAFIHLERGQFVGSMIRDGKFVIDRVPAGRRSVTVEGDGVPPKYAVAFTSDLSVEVKEGENPSEWNLDERNFHVIGGKLTDPEIRQIEASVSRLTKDPILGIEIKQPGTIEVMTGVIRGPLDGEGSIFQFEKRKGKWTHNKDVHKGWVS
jgi:hypothetical protein